MEPEEDSQGLPPSLSVSEGSGKTLLQPVLAYPTNGSFQQLKLIPQSRLPPLLLSTRVAYQSKSFRCLLFFSFVAPILTITLMTGSLGAGTFNTAYIFLGDKFSFTAITLPTIVCPSGAFQVLLAPFSRILRNNMRDTN